MYYFICFSKAEVWGIFHIYFSSEIILLIYLFMYFALVSSSIKRQSCWNYVWKYYKKHYCLYKDEFYLETSCVQLSLLCVSVSFYFLVNLWFTYFPVNHFCHVWSSTQMWHLYNIHVVFCTVFYARSTVTKNVSGP